MPPIIENHARVQTTLTNWAADMVSGPIPIVNYLNSPTAMIQLTEKQWADLHNRLAKEYHDEPSVLIIRGKTRRVLGFTVRRHTDYIEERSRPDRDPWHWPKKSICLDFYDDAKETWFRLKYMEYL